MSRVVEDQSAPIPEKITSKLRRIIYKDEGRSTSAVEATQPPASSMLRCSEEEAAGAIVYREMESDGILIDRFSIRR